MDTIFTIRNEQLAALAPDVAVSFFRNLLWADARRLGIPLNLINISMWTNVADGGIDASVTGIPEAKIATTGIGLIQVGMIGYQIKTGTAFQPWQRAQIKEELFGRNDPSKDVLGEAVRNCLNQDGKYILVCFGIEFTDPQRINTVAHYQGFFTQCGYPNAKVEVWGQSNLVGFIQHFPSLALWLNDRGNLQFQTHAAWSQQDDMRQEFKESTTRDTLINNLQEMLRQYDKTVHLRVWGEPGIGKSRLVLEVTKADDLRPQVIYCSSTDKFRDSELMNEFIRENNQFSAILILDECDPDSRSYIWNKFKHIGPRLKLITIYSEYDLISGDIPYFDVPGLEDEQISEIIQEYGIDKHEADRWKEICSGSPRVAHVIGLNLRNNPEDVLRPPDTVRIWDRFVAGADELASVDVQHRKLVMSFIALFKRFGIHKSIVDEAKAISSLIERANPQITWARFQEIIQQLKARRILQGDAVLYITPKALHIQLWIEWWDIYGAGFDFDELSQELPDALREGFYEMFKYARESQAADRIVTGLLAEDGPFQTNDYLKTKLGSDFFLALVEANPEAALRRLQKTVGIWTKQERFEAVDSRRNIVWALEKIAIWKDLFRGAARLLLLLAETEIENFSNNASGVFANLFSPAPGSVAPTEASPQERFIVLKEALESSSSEIRKIALNACSVALESRSFVRTVGAEYQGLRRVVLWKPATRDEFVDAYRRVWELLVSHIDRLEQDEQAQAIEIILQHARALTRVPDFAEMIVADLRNLEKNSFVGAKSVIEVAESVLYYDKSTLPTEIVQLWEKIRDDLVGNDYPSLMRRYVGMDLLEDKFDEDRVRTDKTAEPLGELVEQTINDKTLLDPELSWLVTDEAKNGYRFAFELGMRDESFSMLPAFLNAQRESIENRSDYTLGGYLKALYERDYERWEQVLDELSRDSAFAILVPSLTWRSGMSDRAALRILQLAQEDVVPVRDFAMFGIGGSTDSLSESVFTQWINFLLRSGDENAASIALELYDFYYLRNDEKRELPKQLTIDLITHPSLYTPATNRRHVLEFFHWSEIGKSFIQHYPEESLQLADLILEHFDEEGTILQGQGRERHQVIDQITQTYPEEVWDRLTKYLGPPIDARAFRLTYWLKGEVFFQESEGSLPLFSPDSVWEWVSVDPDKRAWYLATFVPKQLFRSGVKVCWARELLVKYGDRDDVRRNLTATFSSGGWVGSLSLHFQQQKEWLLKFREEEDNSNVILWIDEFVSRLDRYIEEEKLREEREDF